MAAMGTLEIEQVFTRYDNPKGNAETERLRRTIKEERSSALPPAQIVHGDGRARVPGLLRHLLPRRPLNIRSKPAWVPAPDRRLQAGLIFL
jgi:hypothetical protein